MNYLISIIVFSAPFLVIYNSNNSLIQHPISGLIWIALIVTFKLLISELEVKEPSTNFTDTSKIIRDLKETNSYLYALLAFITMISLITIFF